MCFQPFSLSSQCATFFCLVTYRADARLSSVVPTALGLVCNFEEVNYELGLAFVPNFETTSTNPTISALVICLVLACGQVASSSMAYAHERNAPANWAPLANLPPGGSVINLLLLTDGTVIAQSGDDGQHWFKLTPDAHGSYVNGTWTTLAPMSFPRIYFATNILQDGRVWLLGGEYTGPYFDANIAPSGEIYDPVKDTWSPIAPYPNEVGGCGHRNVTSDVHLTAGSPVVTGIYSTDRLTPGWTITGNGIPAGATVVSVDSATQVTISANATLSGLSQAVRFRGIALACFGDDPAILISGHRILAGNIFDNSTNLYSVDTDSWTQGATKVYKDRSDEEGWTNLAGGGILVYDLFQSVAAGQGYAEVYDQNQNTWSAISPADGTASGTLPVLTGPELGFELGPSMRLQDGRAFVIGANQHTATLRTHTLTHTRRQLGDRSRYSKHIKQSLWQCPARQFWSGRCAGCADAKRTRFTRSGCWSESDQPEWRHGDGFGHHQKYRFDGGPAVDLAGLPSRRKLERDTAEHDHHQH